VKTGSFEKLNQDHKIRITLPPGSAQDQTTCNQNTITATIVPANMGELDIAGPVKLITFQAVDRLCFAAGAPGVTYFPSTGVGTITLSGSGVIFQVPLRVQGGAMSTGQACASQTGVQQTVKFWVGQRDIESGADFTQDSFRIKSPQ
jgi:hypothetical protein